MLAAVALLAVIVGLAYAWHAFDESTSISIARTAVTQLAGKLKQVHRDSGYWPLGNSVWSPDHEFPSRQIEPRPFRSDDTALMDRSPPSMPLGYPPIPPCERTAHRKPCWDGPYLPAVGASMEEAHDPWGHPYMFAYIRPKDGWGGGTSAAPNGFILVWSNGPDGIDQTGCSTGACSINYDRMAQGLSSLPFCDAPSAAPESCSDDLVATAGPAVQD